MGLGCAITHPEKRRGGVKTRGGIRSVFNQVNKKEIEREGKGMEGYLAKHKLKMGI